jgi:putative phosphoesterase
MVGSEVRLGLLSDIHANKPALEAVLRALEGVDKIFCVGDLVGYYTDPNGVIAKLLECDITFIIGNHDWYLNNAPPKPNRLLRQSIQFTSSVILPEYRRMLADKPSQLHFELDGVRISLYHGSPWDTLEEYIYPDYPHFERFDDIDADVIILGHTHHAMIRSLNNRLLVNPGSCGQPRDNDWRAACAVLDTQTRSVQIVRVEYDINSVVRSVHSCGLDAYFAKALLRYYPEKIDRQDERK